MFYCVPINPAQMSSEPCRVWEQLKRRSSFQVLPTMDNQRKSNSATRELNHPAFQNIRICLVRVLTLSMGVYKERGEYLSLSS